jgi:hypothetical protein
MERFFGTIVKSCIGVRGDYCLDDWGIMCRGIESVIWTMGRICWGDTWARDDFVFSCTGIKKAGGLGIG